MKVRISDDAVALACGADAVAAAFVAAGAEVERVSSWGMHWLEPLVDVDGVGYGPVAVGDVASILNPSLLQGRGRSSEAAEGEGESASRTDSPSPFRPLGPPSLSPEGERDLCIGPIAEHPFIARQTRLTFARAGKTRPLSLDDYTATGGWQGLDKAREVGPVSTIETILQSGLRGRGGAGFPAGIKWRTVAEAQGARKYIVCNADEGDSGTFADRMVMEGDPFLAVEGMAIAGLAVGAAKGFVYIRSEYPHAIQKMEAAIRLSASRVAPFELEVRVGAGAYVCGEETSLLNSLEGKRGEVRAKPPLPAHEGLFGCPTVINNVLTLAAVPWIMANGGEAYAAFGMGRSKGTMPIQLAGNIKHGGLFETAFGVTLGELVNDIGGGTATGKPVRAVQVGGPLGAYHPPSQFDLPFDYESFAAADGLIGHGGIVVFDDSVDMAKQARFAMEFCAIESCGKCTPCRLGSTRGVEVLDQVIARRNPPRSGEVAAKPTEGSQSPTSALAAKLGDPSTASGPQLAGRLAPSKPPSGARSGEDLLELITDLCETMKYGSLCALGGFTPYPVMSAINHFPEDFA